MPDDDPRFAVAMLGRPRLAVRVEARKHLAAVPLAKPRVNGGSPTVVEIVHGRETLLVNSHANLAAISAASTTYPAIVSYGTVEGDGGGGIFVPDASRINENDGGIVLDGWVRQYSGAIDIRWFGASLTATDNGPAINAAIDVAVVTGHEVWIPPGDWSVRTKVSLDRAQAVTIRGAGAGYQESPSEVFLGSWLRWTGGGATTCVLSMDGASNCVVKRIGVEGAGVATAVVRLTSDLGSGFSNRIEDCFIRNGADVCLELGGTNGCGDNLISHTKLFYAGRSCVRQTGIQTIGNRICDRSSLYGWTSYAFEYVTGDLHIDEVVMTDTLSALGSLGDKACVWVGNGVGPTISIRHLYAETFHDGVFFEADPTSLGIYSASIRDSRFYVLAQDGRTVRMIYYPRVSPLLLEANTYQIAVNGSVTAINNFIGIGAGGHPQTAVLDIGSSYFNDAYEIVPADGSVSYVRTLVQNGANFNAGEVGLVGVEVPLVFGYQTVPSWIQVGTTVYLTNARKIGEGPGAGTGVPCYKSADGWFYRTSDDSIALM